MCAPKKSKKIYTKSTWSGRDPLVKPACIEGAVLKPSRTIVDNSSGVTRTVFFSGTEKTAVDFCMIWYICMTHILLFSSRGYFVIPCLFLSSGVRSLGRWANEYF